MTSNIQHQSSSTIPFFSADTQARHVHSPIGYYSLNAIMAGSDIAVWALDVNTLRVNVCPTFKKLLSLPEKPNYLFAELFRKIDAANRDLFIKNIRSGCLSPSTFSIEFMIKDLSEPGCRWYKLSGKAYSQTGETKVDYMGTLTEITDAKAKEIWNNDRLALLSHELKGPLSVIKLYLQRAGKISSEKKLTDAALFLNKADDQVSAMALLMDDFLSFSTIGNTKLNLCYECFDLRTVVDEIVIQMQMKHPGNHFMVKVPALINIRADKRKIIQVIQNYISNAVKYSPENSRIELKCKNRKGETIFSVTDAGMGIDPAFQQKVFERYYRTPGTNADGFGLGLYLVNAIVTAHGGRVWVDSTMNVGSVFYFSVPQLSNNFNCSAR